MTDKYELAIRRTATNELYLELRDVIIKHLEPNRNDPGTFPIIGAALESLIRDFNRADPDFLPFMVVALQMDLPDLPDGKSG